MFNNRNNKGTGFVNFNDILKANQGAGSRMGRAVAGGLEQQSQSVGEELGKEKEKFGQELDRAQNVWDTKSQLAKQLAEKSLGGQWSDIANQTGNINEVGKAFGRAGYAGPKGLQNASGLQQQGYSAQQTGNLSRTGTGQQALLSQFSGARNYTPGQAQLDQVLLGGEGRNLISKSAKNLASKGNEINKSLQQAEQKAKATAGGIEAEKTALKDQIKEGGQKLIKEGQAAGKEFNTARDQFQALLDLQSVNSPEEYNKILTEKFGGSLSDEQMNSILANAQRFGLDQGFSGEIYGRPEEQAELIRQLAGSFQTADPGATYLDENQRKALLNLESFANPDVVKSMEDYKMYETPTDITDDEALYGQNRKLYEDAMAAKQLASQFDKPTMDYLKYSFGTGGKADYIVPALYDAITSSSSSGNIKDMVKNILWNAGIAGHTGGNAWADKIAALPQLQKYIAANDALKGRTQKTIRDILAEKIASLRGNNNG